MGLGVLEGRDRDAHYPGTATLEQLEGSPEEAVQHATHLKRDPKSGIVLVPQPSEDPNDPYNWSRTKKELFCVTYVLGCGVVGAIGPILGPAYTQLAAQFEVPLSTFNIGLQGGPIACVGVGSLVCNTLAVKFGKRPIYLTTGLVLMICCFWAAASKSLTSLIISRLFTGFCMAPLEALVPATIADVWFVHERGFRTSLFNLGVLGGINLASVISGPVIQYAGFRTCLYAIGGVFGLHLIMVFFFMPETAFARTSDGIPLVEPADASLAAEKAEVFHDEAVEGKTAPASAAPAEPGSGPGSVPELKSKWQELAPWSGYNHDVAFFKTLLRPLALIVSPTVIWSALVFSTCVGWLVGISISLSQIFSAPPYSFSIADVGFTNASSFIASLIGMLAAGPISDLLAKSFSKRNAGIYEPEFRLPIISLYLLFSVPGFMAWGQSLFNQDPWPIPVVVCLGLINVGIQLGAAGAIVYVVDANPNHAGEAVGAVNFIKNMFAFGLVFFINNWIVDDGVRIVFFCIGGITAFAALTAIPMYLWGKRARGWTFRTLSKWKEF